MFQVDIFSFCVFGVPFLIVVFLGIEPDIVFANFSRKKKKNNNDTIGIFGKKWSLLFLLAE